MGFPIKKFKIINSEEHMQYFVSSTNKILRN